MTSAELVALLSGTPPPIVFDVRTGEEFARSHLPGSTLLPWSDPQRFVSELPAEKSQTLVFYCNGPT